MASAMTCYQNMFAVTRFASSQKARGLKVEALTENDKAEALDFLSARPIHSVCMSSFLQDNGVISSLNRGTFYGCRNTSGKLEGVALIGHATLIETQNDDALQAFAYVKHHFTNAHLIRGEHETISRFWKHYAELGHQPRLAFRETLFVQENAHPQRAEVPNLCPATLDELEAVKSVNAKLIIEECGVDPLERDPEGFTSRLARRISKNRVWILQRDNTVVFKADVFAQTPLATYLEGIFVHPDYRGRGIGLSCMRDLSSRLLKESAALVVLVNEQEAGLEHFYKQAGFSIGGQYDTIYLNSNN